MDIPQQEWDLYYSTGDIPWRTSTNMQHWLELADVFNGVALELGCGTGDQALWLAQNGFEVEGLDYSVEAIKIAEENLVEGLTFATWDLEQLEQYQFLYDKYDLIVCREVLMFLKDQDKFLQTVADKLRGTFILQLFLSHDEKPELAVAEEDIVAKLNRYFTIFKQEKPSTREGVAMVNYFLRSK